jgi:hypothetical protein
MENHAGPEAPTRTELIACGVISGSTISAEKWTTSGWSAVACSPAPTVSENYWWGCDVAYEQQSGDAVLVWNDNSQAAGSKLRYSVWNGTSWSAEASLDPGLVTDTQPQWLAVDADPASNSIVLGVQTASGTGNDIWLSVWNGTSWSTPIAATAAATGYVYPNVAVAFEGTSGETLAAFGSGTDTSVHYRTWSSAGGWSAELTGPAIDGIPNSLTLDASRTTDEIMLSVQDAGSDLNYVLWGGSAWGAPSELETNTAEVKNQPFAFVWFEAISPSQPTISSAAN